MSSEETTPKATAGKQRRFSETDKALILWLMATDQPDEKIKRVIEQWGRRIDDAQIRRIRSRNRDGISRLACYLGMRIPTGELLTPQQRLAKLEQLADDVEQRMNRCEDREYTNLLAKYLTVIKQIAEEVQSAPAVAQEKPKRPRREITLAQMLAEGEPIDEETERDLFRALRRAQAAASAINSGGGEDQPDVEDGQ